LLNKFFICAFIFLLVTSAGCEDDKPTPAPKKEKEERIMSPSTSLAPSGQDTIIYSLINGTPDRLLLQKALKNKFGVISYEIKQNTLSIVYNPSVISPDTLAEILQRNGIPFK